MTSGGAEEILWLEESTFDEESRKIPVSKLRLLTILTFVLLIVTNLLAFLRTAMAFELLLGSIEGTSLPLLFR